MHAVHGGRACVAALAFVLLLSPCVRAQQLSASMQSMTIRGHSQMLHIYGPPTGHPVIVASGDGGWIHLGPHVAETLAATGHFVVGFDAKAYLESFTGGATLRPDNVATDYKALVDFASAGTTAKPILIGVSEGAGLSVLAA